MNSYSPFKPHNRDSFSTRKSRPFDDCQRWKLNSFDLSHMHVLNHAPGLSSSLIYRNMREQLSSVRSDIEDLIRSEQATAEIVSMEKLEMNNQTLRRELLYSRKIQEGLRLDIKQYQVREGINMIRTNRIEQGSKSPLKSRLKEREGMLGPRPGDLTHRSSYQASPKEPRVQQFTRPLEQLKALTSLRIQETARLDKNGREIQQAMEQSQAQRAKEKKLLNDQICALKEEIVRSQIQHMSRETALKQQNKECQKGASQCQTLKILCKSQQQNIARLNQEVLILKQNAAESEQTSRRLALKSDNKGDQLVTLRFQHDAHLMRLGIEIDDLKNRLQQSAQIQSNWRIQNTQLLAKVTGLQAELVARNSVLTGFVDKLQEQRQSYQSELSRQVEIKTVHILALEQRVVSTDKLIQDKDGYIVKADLKIADCEANLAKMILQEESLKVQVSRVQNQLQIKNAYIQQVNGILDQRKSCQDTSKLQIQTLRKQICALTQRSQDLQQKLVQQRTINDKKQSTWGQTSQTIVKYNQQLQACKLNVAQLTMTLDTTSRENSKLKHQTNELQEQLKNRTNYLLTLEKEMQAKTPNHSQSYYQSKVSNLETLLGQKEGVIERLESECRQSRVTTTGENSENINIEQVMRRNTAKDTELIASLTAKSQEVIQLRGALEEYKRRVDFMKNQVDINKLKLSSEERNQKSHYEITILNLRSELDSNKRKYQVLQRRLEGKMGQLKKKDQFIQGVIVSRSGREQNQSQSAHFIQQLDKYLGSSYLQRLTTGQQQIVRLKQEIHLLSEVVKRLREPDSN